MKPSKVALIVLRGSKRIRVMVAETVGVKVDTVGKWIREESDELLDARVHDIINRETGIDKESLVEIQKSEKVA